MRVANSLNGLSQPSTGIYVIPSSGQRCGFLLVRLPLALAQAHLTRTEGRNVSVPFGQLRRVKQPLFLVQCEVVIMHMDEFQHRRCIHWPWRHVIGAKP